MADPGWPSPSPEDEELPPEESRWTILILGAILGGIAELLYWMALHPASFGLPAGTPGSGPMAVIFAVFFAVALPIPWYLFVRRRLTRLGRWEPTEEPIDTSPTILRRLYDRRIITYQQYQEMMMEIGAPPTPP